MPPPYSSDVKWEKTIKVITSGNIIDVNNAVSIGGFDEALFIDEVDHEFCFRGIKNGLFIYQCTRGIYLLHKIGNPIEIKIMGKVYHPPAHNYVRTYYIIRNRLYMIRRYWNLDIKWTINHYFGNTARLIVSKIFFEEDKYRKIKSIYYGIMDCILGRMGKKYFKY